MDLTLSLKEAAHITGLEMEQLANALGIARSAQARVAPEMLRNQRDRQGQKLRFLGKGQILAFQGCKGGIGKSTLSYNVAIRAAQYGAKVLCIDMDQQAHLTLCLAQREGAHSCWLDLYEEKIGLPELIQEITPSLHLIPSNLTMALAEKRIGTTVHPRRIFARFIEPLLAVYDLIVVDCAPALSSINHAVAFASDVVVIPQALGKLSTDGLELTLDFLADLEEDYGVKPEVRIAVNFFAQHENAAMRTLAHLMETHGALVLSTAIRRCVHFPDAVDAGGSLFSPGAKKSSARDDVDSLTRELLALPSLD